ncbi:MAG: DUF4926 domain-containing protein [Flavobacteriales bacterium]|jgi:hypothetical protein|nr:DUF4926 domain-containing protein [Flavobacteriales bacterium]MCF8459102.1 DUF4926 domain-containing protein [Flavobacteriales bacterium]
MKTTALKIHDNVVLLTPVGTFIVGQVGVIVGEWNAEFFEVEFVDIHGETIGFSAVPKADLLRLYFSPKAA